MKQLQRSKISYKVCVLVGLHHHTVQKFLFEPAVSNSIFLIFILFLKTEKRKLLENVFSFGEYKFKYKHFDAARDVNLETDI